jgi:hypothetical protein
MRPQPDEKQQGGDERRGNVDESETGDQIVGINQRGEKRRTDAVRRA